MMEPSEARERLTNNMFVVRREDDPIGRLELALDAAPQGDVVEAKLRSAARAGTVSGLTDADRLDSALRTSILSNEEAAALQKFWRLRHACIMVDDFPADVGKAAVLVETQNYQAARKTA